MLGVLRWTLAVAAIDSGSKVTSLHGPTGDPAGRAGAHDGQPNSEYTSPASVRAMAWRT